MQLTRVQSASIQATFMQQSNAIAGWAIEYPRHSTLRPWKFRPSLSLRAASIRSARVYGGRAGGRQLDSWAGTFLTRVPNSKDWCAHAKVLLTVKSGEQG